MRYTVNVLYPLISSVALLALACGDSAPTASTANPFPTPFVITTEDNLTVHVPRTLQISWRGGRDTDTITWRSDDQTIASVSPSGAVTANFPGSTRITARRGNASAALMVIAVATSIEVRPGVALLEVGRARSLTAAVRDADDVVLSGVPIDWATGNSTVVTVDARTGLLTPIAKGTTSITAVGGGAHGSAAVYVDMFGAQLLFTSIGSTGNHVCGLEALTGLAYCWGDNHAGALGIGEQDGSDSPVPVKGALRFKSLSVGNYATCGIEAATALAYCWGSNQFGDLGDGTRGTRWEPTAVVGGLRFSRISASGSHTCGVEAQTGLAYCWGKEGLIGDGTFSQRSTPTLIGSGASQIRFTDISAGAAHTCAIETQTGVAYCWGNNSSGQIGDGTRTDRLAPTMVGGGGDNLHFSSISAGSTLSCGIEALSGFAYCWGTNQYGEIGDGTTSDRRVPTLVGSGSQRFRAISATGNATTCALEAQTGLAYCWGRYVKAGYAADTYRTEPTLVGDGTDHFSNMVAGYSGGCGVDAQAGVGYCWSYREMIPEPILGALSSTAASPQSPVIGHYGSGNKAGR